MKTVGDQLAQYAAYHRDARNIATHFVGIPLIVLAVTVLLSGVQVPWAPAWLTLAWPTALLAAAYYLRLHAGLGLLMSGLLALCLWAGHWAAAQGWGTWLAFGVGAFVVGWIIQFIGHGFEGRKPAFVDDLMGLVIGPLFVVAELLFMLGMLSQLKAEVERRAGPVRRGPPLSFSNGS
jgi:uncharacterized membrane protein YGL010W